MLVYELGMTIPSQQYTEIIEPGDYTLKLHSIDQKDRQRNFGLSNMIEKSILQILGTVGCHCGCSVSCPQPHLRAHCQVALVSLFRGFDPRELGDHHYRALGRTMQAEVQ